MLHPEIYENSGLGVTANGLENPDNVSPIPLQKEKARIPGPAS
jgi:hypothetical protein